MSETMNYPHLLSRVVDNVISQVEAGTGMAAEPADVEIARVNVTALAQMTSLEDVYARGNAFLGLSDDEIVDRVTTVLVQTLNHMVAHGGAQVEGAQTPMAREAKRRYEEGREV